MIKWYKEKFKYWLLTPFIVMIGYLDYYLITQVIEDHYWIFMLGVSAAWCIVTENEWLKKETKGTGGTGQ